VLGGEHFSAFKGKDMCLCTNKQLTRGNAYLKKIKKKIKTGTGAETKGGNERRNGNRNI